MVELGFEGSVLKRLASTYHAGRHRSWRKLKARHVAAVASPAASERIGEGVELAYSRVDVEGALREVRLADR
jgi:hypothetical protein